MIFYLNKGRILEEEIVKLIKDYFTAIDLADDYNGISVNVTNEHPFNTLIGSGGAYTAGLFPAVVVTTDAESKPPKLASLPETAIQPEIWEWAKEDVDQIIEAGYDVTPKVVEKIKSFFTEERNKLYGAVFGAVRQDRISIEIWSENIALKNQIYEKVREFVCCMMKRILEKGRAVTIFDDSIYGQRSNTFNYDFGVSLAGGQITFEADYVIEQSVIDTEITDVNNFLLEVINHAKGYADTTRSAIRLGPSGDGSGQGNPAETGNSGG
jgi:hypothetical protein